MSWNIIYPLIRGLLGARSDISRYQDGRDERRARRAAARAEEERLAGEKYRLDLEQREKLRLEKNEWKRTVRSLNLKIETVEETDALAYYMGRGENLEYAYHSYRLLLEGGTRFPAARDECIAGGRTLRKELRLSTYEDSLWFEADAEERKLAALQEWIRSAKRQMLLGFICAVLIAFVAVGLAVAVEDGTPLLLLFVSTFLIVRCAWFSHRLPAKELLLLEAREQRNT